jgi:hypothetical protein
MPSANPRINTVLERPVYMAIRSLARREGLSLSAMVRRLVHEALELREDAALEALVERRARASAPGLERKARRVFGQTTPPLPEEAVRPRTPAGLGLRSPAAAGGGPPEKRCARPSGSPPTRTPAPAKEAGA